MNKKKEARKKGKSDIELSVEESHELGMILDRLSVQNPEGESLNSYLESLGKTLRNRENLAAALIERLSRNPSEVGYRTFMWFRDLPADPRARRIVKQAGYRFSQKGFADEADSVQTEKVVLIQKEERTPSAHMLPVPGAFFLLSALVYEPGSPAPTAVSVFAEDRFRMLNAKATESSQRLYRDYLRNIAAHAEKKPCRIPLWHAARVFFDMLGFHGGEATSPEVSIARRIFDDFHDPGRKPYAYELMPGLDQPPESLRAMDPTELLHAVDSPWLYFSRDELLPWRQKIQELESPLLVVPREIQRERVKDELVRAADELCSGRTRLMFQRFFEEYAVYFKLSGKDELAADALAVADHLRGTADAGENPAVLRLVILSMHRYWPEDFEGQQEDGEGDLRRSESGLILPG